MCRLLLIQSSEPFIIKSHLEKFAALSKKSKEYQGHGWGCAYLNEGEWTYYKNLQPVWEDDPDQFGSTPLFLAHARSAFRDEGIEIENNMPFYDGRYVFIFNGELHGVRIRAEGRIGAEKIFNFIKRFDHGDLLAALKKAVFVIQKRSRYVKAMNLIVSDRERAYVASCFSEDPDYFTLWFRRWDRGYMICSEPFPEEGDWCAIQNETVEVFAL